MQENNQLQEADTIILGGGRDMQGLAIFRLPFYTVSELMICK